MSRPLMVVVHAALIAAAGYLACWLRFDGDVPREVFAAYTRVLPLELGVRGLIFAPLGLYGGLWRYAGVWDLSRILIAVVSSSVAVFVLVHEMYGPSGFPRSIVIIETLLLISFIGGARLFRRFTQLVPRSDAGRRVLIIGAGDAGEMIVREMRRGVGYQPVGFIDDNPAKVGRTIHGVSVLGTRDALRQVIRKTKPEEVLIAIPSEKASAARALVQMLEPFKLSITTLPDLKELVNGRVGVKHIRPLAIEDLLPRSPISLDVAAVKRLIAGRRVLVTGAGGSIGSELCRQIAKLEPSSLILFERYENSLYAIANDLGDAGKHVPVHPTIADVTDAARVDAVFAAHRPQLVFHAAAHKHVPLMEFSPCEAVKNNIEGTRIVAEAARRHGVERFVLISTDKAANPSSVMGATKRIAEMVVQATGAESTTRFVTVRFGNVLGSNGSVIPRMVDQIRAGGPVTVTHPDMRRFFMLIPEAVELVLQAAVLARAREAFVLDMGEQLKVLDVARNLIRLHGLTPERDIPIKFIGLRPGEKLTEELTGDGEVLEPSDVSKISRVRWSNEWDERALMARVSTLVRVATEGHVDDALGLMRQIVPTFTRPQHGAVITAKSTHGEPSAAAMMTVAAASHDVH